jgi:hypothetical protein
VTDAVVTVVNHLRLAEPVPESAFRAIEETFPRMQELGCRACQLVEVTDRHLILVLVFDSRDAATEVSKTYGGPWMNEHIRPRLAGDTERNVGEAIVSLGL